MNRTIYLLLALLPLWLFGRVAVAQAPVQPPPPRLDYEPVPGFFQLPAGENFVEAAGVAVNSRDTCVMGMISAAIRPCRNYPAASGERSSSDFR